MIAHIDFESRSLVDLTATSTSRYAEDPSTGVLCLAIKVGDSDTMWWMPHTERLEDPPPDLARRFITTEELQHTIEIADLIYAHNSSFERALWHHVMHLRLGFPAIPLNKWRCTAAMAAMHNLPRSLDQATTVLGLTAKKDKKGRALMLKMTNPLPPTKAQYLELAKELSISYEDCRAAHQSSDMKSRWYSGEHDRKLIRWHDTPAAYADLIRYCIQDVEVEHALTKRLKPLPKAEQEVFELDAVINNRGIPVDLEAVKAFIELTDIAQTEADEAFSLATGGEVASPKCYVAFAKWVNDQGVKCDGVGAGAIEELLERDNLPPNVREALEVAQAANKASTAKYHAMLRGASADGRVRDTLLYHGAGTGRASGKLVQYQNLPRGSFTDVDNCIAAVMRREFDLVEMLWGSPMAAASTCIRGMTKASPGHDLIAADYSAIEGRVLAWLADEESELAVYREGRDPYIAAAASAFNLKYADIAAGVDSGDSEAKGLRQKGKTSVLACLGGNTKVLIRDEKGEVYYKRIIEIVAGDKVHDGLNWVSQQGVESRGYKLTGRIGDLHITPDHMVLKDGIWIQAWEHPDFKGTKNELQMEPVMDLLNCGPLHRFIVHVGNDMSWGREMIVHNCGYGGGKNAVKRFAPDMPAKDAADLVRRWREAHPKTKAFWYATTDAAANAVRFPGGVYHAGKIAFMYRKEYGFLMMKLPGGRLLYYAFPTVTKEWVGTKVAARKALASPGSRWRFADMEIWFDKTDNLIHILPEGEDEWTCEPGDDRLWEKENWRVQAWVVDGVTKKWVQRDLSHLVLVENSVQAIARDLLIQNTLPKLEAAGYPVIFHVHDEAVAEVPEGFGSVEEFCEIMCDLPPWADGLPIKAEGWRGKRFRK